MSSPVNYYCPKCGKPVANPKIEQIDGHIRQYVKLEFTCNCLARVYIRMYEGGR